MHAYRDCMTLQYIALQLQLQFHYITFHYITLHYIHTYKQANRHTGTHIIHLNISQIAFLASMEETWPSWPSPGHGDLARRIPPSHRSWLKCSCGWNWSLSFVLGSVLFTEIYFLSILAYKSNDHEGHEQESYWDITKVGMSKTAQEAEPEPGAVPLLRQARSIVSIQLHQFAFVFYLGTTS